jgi:hypothetical protein
VTSRSLNIVFSGGLLVSVAVLLNGDAAALERLLPLGIVHVSVLAAVGWKTRVPHDQHVVTTLHRAGFLHTLIGLGAAVMSVARLAGQSGALVADTGLALAPLGAALVPHVLGVWLAHIFEMSRMTPATPATVDRKLTESVEAVLKSLDRVQAAAAVFGDRVGAATRAGLDSAVATADALRALSTVSRDTESAAVALKRAVDDVAKTTTQIHLVHAQLVELVRAELLRRS